MVPDAEIRHLVSGKPAEVHTVLLGTSVFDALSLMARREIGAVPVLDRSGSIVGVFSERDYARKVVLHGKSSRETPVEDIMSAPAILVTPERTVRECMEIMTEKRVRHLPVVENGILLGIVSVGDLVKWIISAQENAIQHLQSYIAGAYPA